MLLAILRLKHNAYGMAIQRELETRTGRTLVLGAVFMALNRMAAKKWVRRCGTQVLEHGKGGRPRVYHEVTALGRKQLRDSELARRSLVVVA